MRNLLSMKYFDIFSLFNDLKEGTVLWMTAPMCGTYSLISQSYIANYTVSTILLNFCVPDLGLSYL